MGCFTIYCIITGRALKVPVHFEDEDVKNKKHPYYKCDVANLDSDNTKKYSHLNDVVVVLSDSTISKVGCCDEYGRVEINDSDQVYECANKYEETNEKPFGIAISNTVYLLMKDDARFQKLLDNKNLFQKLDHYYCRSSDLSEKEYPYTKVNGAQDVMITNEYGIDFKDLWSYVNPFLIEKVDEPFLGKTLIRQKYRQLNGKKSKKLNQILIDKFLGN
jgi:hypothetical protein